ncbi:MAG: hypothetical protein IPK24_11240 [Kineosporiaceae bacterium]|nr:hypothetical protein [Kineosporiaceae bacterium]
MAYSEVVALGNQALISGDLAALAHAVQAAEDLLVHLAPGHPSAAELQGLVCQLLTRRVTVTTSPRDLPLALDAGGAGGEAVARARRGRLRARRCMPSARWSTP